MASQYSKNSKQIRQYTASYFDPVKRVLGKKGKGNPTYTFVLVEALKTMHLRAPYSVRIWEQPREKDIINIRFVTSGSDSFLQFDRKIRQFSSLPSW